MISDGGGDDNGAGSLSGPSSSLLALFGEKNMMANINSARWFFPKESLENTPSRRCRIDADKELCYRQQSANFIQDMGQRLQVNQLCINTAIVYMHRFYMYHSYTQFHRYPISTAAIFLAAKVEEQPRKLEHVIKVSHHCLHRESRPIDAKSDHYAELSAELVMNENILLQTLGFDVNIDHPHTHVVKCCQLVRASRDLAQTSYFMATNSLHLTTMCLQYRPTVVASVCIHLACKWSNWEIPRSKEGKDWFWYVDDTVTLEQLEQLTTEFLNIFNRSPSRLRKKIMSLNQGGTVGLGSSASLNLGSFPSNYLEDAKPFIYENSEKPDSSIISSSSQPSSSTTSSNLVNKKLAPPQPTQLQQQHNSKSRPTSTTTTTSRPHQHPSKSISTSSIVKPNHPPTASHLHPFVKSGSSSSTNQQHGSISSSGSGSNVGVGQSSTSISHIQPLIPGLSSTSRQPGYNKQQQPSRQQQQLQPPSLTAQSQPQPIPTIYQTQQHNMMKKSPIMPSLTANSHSSSSSYSTNSHNIKPISHNQEQHSSIIPSSMKPPPPLIEQIPNYPPQHHSTSSNKQHQYSHNQQQQKQQLPYMTHEDMNKISQNIKREPSTISNPYHNLTTNSNRPSVQPPLPPPQIQAPLPPLPPPPSITQQPPPPPPPSNNYPLHQQQQQGSYQLNSNSSSTTSTNVRLQAPVYQPPSQQQQQQFTPFPFLSQELGRGGSGQNSSIETSDGNLTSSQFQFNSSEITDNTSTKQQQHQQKQLSAFDKLIVNNSLNSAKNLYNFDNGTSSTSAVKVKVEGINLGATLVMEDDLDTLSPTKIDSSLGLAEQSHHHHKKRKKEKKEKKEHKKHHGEKKHKKDKDKDKERHHHKDKHKSRGGSEYDSMPSPSSAISESTGNRIKIKINHPPQSSTSTTGSHEDSASKHSAKRHKGEQPIKLKIDLKDKNIRGDSYI